MLYFSCLCLAIVQKWCHPQNRKYILHWHHIIKGLNDIGNMQWMIGVMRTLFLICATDIQTDMLITRLYTPTRVYYSAPDRGVEYCLSVIMSSELHVRFSPTFYACYLWPVAWSSSGSVVICCVFPALWMRDYLQSGLQWACWVFMTSCLHNHSLTTPLPLTRFSARYALLRVLCYFTLKINYKL